MSQDLTCTFTNGNGTKTFHRDGVRDGDRTGTREGSRTGTREGSRDGERDGIRTGTQTGTQTGSLAYDLDVEARKANQYTGFILKGWNGTPSYTRDRRPRLERSGFGDVRRSATYELRRVRVRRRTTFAGDYDFGAYTFEP